MFKGGRRGDSELDGRPKPRRREKGGKEVSERAAPKAEKLPPIVANLERGYLGEGSAVD